MTKQQRMDLYDILHEYIAVEKRFNEEEKNVMFSMLITLKECEKPTNYWFTMDRCKHYIAKANRYNMED